MAITWTKELFDLAYSIDAEPEGHPNTRDGIKLHYNRYAVYPIMLARAQKFIEVMGLTTSDLIVIVGCGFGWTVEALQSFGMTVVGCDTSPYIQDSKGLTEDPDIDAAVRKVGLDPASGIGMVHFNRLKNSGGTRAKTNVLNQNSSSNQSRVVVRNALGGRPTVVITEDVMPSLTDAECLTLQLNLEQYATGVRICHLITELANPNPPFNLNSKTGEDWKLLLPNSTIIPIGGKDRVL